MTGIVADGRVHKLLECETVIGTGRMTHRIQASVAVGLLAVASVSGAGPPEAGHRAHVGGGSADPQRILMNGITFVHHCDILPEVACGIAD